MVQAARSGKQNIAEGSMASATSRETEIKLTNVARASLEELLLDYEDYLRMRGLRLWDKDSPESLLMRKASLRHDHSEWFLNLAHSRNDEVFANMAVCLIYQAAFLLKKQLNVLEERFLQEGGLRENDPSAEAEEKVGKLVKAIVSPVSFVPMVLPGNFRAGLQVKRYVFMTVAP